MLNRHMADCDTRAPRWIELVAEWRKRRRDRRLGRVYRNEADVLDLPPAEYQEVAS